MFDWAILRKWRCSPSNIASDDPQQRIAAINEGKAGQNGLRRLAVSDTVERVRAAAAKRLIDLVILRQILEQESSEDVVAAARARYRQLLSGGDELELSYRLAAVQACNDRQILAHVARSAREADLRQAALLRVDSREVLLEISRHDPSEQVCRAADEQLAQLRAQRKLL